MRDVIKWREAKLRLPSDSDEKRSEEILKLRQQNEKLTLEIQEKKGNTITRDAMIEKDIKSAAELMAFLKGGYKRNGTELWNEIRKCKTLSYFLGKMDDFIKQAMDAFTSGGDEI